MADDGNIYPPELHPDAAGGLPRPTAPPTSSVTPPPFVPPSAAGAPASTVSPPAQGRGTSPEAARSARAGLWAGVIGALVVVGVLVTGFVGYRLLFALPSEDDDLATLEAALPTAEDVPPGLISGEELEENSDDDGDSDCTTTGVDPRAQVEVSFFEGVGDLGEQGFAMSAASLESAEEAEAEVVEADQDFLDRCFTASSGLTAKPTTGGVDRADSSTVFILEGIGGRIYATVAQKDRFVVMAMATDAERVLDLAGDALERL